MANGSKSKQNTYNPWAQKGGKQNCQKTNSASKQVIRNNKKKV